MRDLATMDPRSGDPAPEDSLLLAHEAIRCQRTRFPIRCQRTRFRARGDADDVSTRMPRLPRTILPGYLHEVTLKTFQARFRLTPDGRLNDLLVGVLGRAQRLFGLRVCAVVVLSNHLLCGAPHKRCCGERQVMWSYECTWNLAVGSGREECA